MKKILIAVTFVLIVFAIGCSKEEVKIEKEDVPVEEVAEVK